MKNIIKPLAKTVFIPLGLTAAASAADVVIHTKILGSGYRPSSSVSYINTILIISNDGMKYIIKIVKSLQDSILLLEGVSETIQTKAKEQRGVFNSMLLGTLGTSLLGNILAGREINRAGEGVFTDGYGNKKGQKTRKKRQDHESLMDF